MQKSLLINGQPDATLSHADRGVSYGHGLFETIRVFNHQPVYWDAHLQRLLAGCQRLGINADGLIDHLNADIRALSLPQQGGMKLVVTGGVGGRGYAINSHVTPTRIVSVFDYPVDVEAQNQGVHACFCDTRLSHQPLLAGIKHLNRLEQVLARSELTDTDFKEGIVLDTAGFIREGTFSNLFFVKAGTLFTPNLQLCGVEGVLRAQVLAFAEQIGISVEIGDYSSAQLMAADEVFVTNSLIGVWPIIQIEHHRFALGELTRQIQNSLSMDEQVKDSTA